MRYRCGDACHTVCPHTRSNPITQYRQSPRSPATRRVYTSMFRAPPQWHGATQTHFPPRPRKSAWRCDITNVISPHGLPSHVSHDTANPPAHQRHAAFTPPCFALPCGTAPQIRMALRHHERNFATRSAHIHITRYRQSSRSPATRRVYTSMFRAPRRHANALLTKTLQIRMALRHHERNSPHGLPTH